MTYPYPIESFRMPAPAQAFVIPPACASIPPSTVEAVWFGVNYAVGMRFMLTHRFTPSNVQMACTVASGNIEVAIHQVVRTGVQIFSLTKVASSGVIACPATGSGGAPPNSILVPFVTPPVLDIGQYIVSFWADNTTIAVAHILANSLVRDGFCIDAGGPQAGGTPTSSTGKNYAGRAVALSIEGSL